LSKAVRAAPRRWSRSLSPGPRGRRSPRKGAAAGFFFFFFFFRSALSPGYAYWALAISNYSQALPARSRGPLAQAANRGTLLSRLTGRGRRRAGGGGDVRCGIFNHRTDVALFSCSFENADLRLNFHSTAEREAMAHDRATDVKGTPIEYRMTGRSLHCRCSIPWSASRTLGLAIRGFGAGLGPMPVCLPCTVHCRRRRRPTRSCVNPAQRLVIGHSGFVISRGARHAGPTRTAGQKPPSPKGGRPPNEAYWPETAGSFTARGAARCGEKKTAGKTREEIREALTGGL